jgi:histidinol-phosphatase
MLDPFSAPYDLAPLQVIVEEAGGKLGDYRGNAGIYGESAVSTNGLLHEAVLAILRQDPPPAK